MNVIVKNEEGDVVMECDSKTYAIVWCSLFPYRSFYTIHEV